MARRWNGPVTPAAGSFDVKELFAEVNVPVLKEAKYADRLSFGAAFRASDYSTVGQTNSWKLDTVYAPIRSVTLRATYAQAVRAPNIAELFSPGDRHLQLHRRSLRHQRTEQRHRLREQRIARRC